MAAAPDPQAILTEAYDLYADAIFRHCYFRIFDRDRARELMQDTFVRTWEYLCKGEKIDNVRAFLYKVANNLVIDEVRKKKEMSLDSMMEAGFNPGYDASNDMKAKVDESRVLATFKKLEKHYREVLIMRHVDGLTPSEIADITGESANVISVRLHRGLQQLKSHFEGGND